MIGVVVPAHDEEALIGACLAALGVAALHPDLAQERVEIVVVLDACTDATARIAAAQGVHSLRVDARNVGVARARGADELLRRGARWLAFTDADSEVDACWLARQVSQQSDAVCGVVAVDDWSTYPPQARRAYEALYQDREHHPHVHGASFGVASQAYVRAGGFPPLACSEDVAFVERLALTGARITRTNTVRVRTSARRLARAPGGFAAYLSRLDDESLLATVELASPANFHPSDNFTNTNPVGSST